MFIRILLAFLLGSGSCLAQSNCEQLTSKAMEIYGCLDSLRTFPKQMGSQIAAQMTQEKSLSSEQKARLADVMLKSLNVDRLITNVTKETSAGCNPEEVQKLIETLRSPLLQRMRKLESQTGTPELAEHFQKVLNLPEVQSPPEKRAVLVRSLIDATGAGDVVVETVLATTHGLLSGLGAPPLTVQQIAQLREQIEGSSTQQFNLMMLAVYHDATDQELEQYVAALNSKPFKDFNNSFGKALIHGVSEESRFAGMALKRFVEEEKAAQTKPKS